MGSLLNIMVFRPPPGCFVVLLAYYFLPLAGSSARHTPSKLIILYYILSLSVQSTPNEGDWKNDTLPCDTGVTTANNTYCIEDRAFTQIGLCTEDCLIPSVLIESLFLDHNV